MEYLDKFFQTHKVHYSSQSTYLTTWMKVNVKTTHHLPLSTKKFKVRIYDFYFHDITYQVNYNNLILQENQSMNKLEHWFDNQLLNLRFRIHYKNDLYEFNIFNIYQTKTHTVLCSTPDARTLTKAYNNNPKMAHSLLSKFCPDEEKRMQIINSAKFIKE